MDPKRQRALDGQAEQAPDPSAVRRDLAVQRLKEHVAGRTIQQRRVQPEDRDQAPRGERGTGTRENRAVRPDEVKRRIECPAVHALAYARMGINLLEGEEIEATRRHAPVQPRRRCDTQAAVAVVEQRARSIHAPSLRSSPGFASPSPWATLWQ